MSEALFKLDGLTAMVTGASSGLGREIAFALASAGAKVVLVARRRERLEAARSAIEDRGGSATVAVADLEDAEALGDMAATLAAETAPDILVNAAGFNPRRPAEDVDLATWRRTLDIHLTAPFLLAKALVPAMRQRRWGRIINIASLQSVRAFDNGMPYGTAKGGVVQMTRAMAQAWSKDGINCNAIAPGFFPTELTAPVFDDQSLASTLAQSTMIGRNGELRDIHGIAIFLAAHASDYITGQTIFVDGGFTAR